MFFFILLFHLFFRGISTTALQCFYQMNDKIFQILDCNRYTPKCCISELYVRSCMYFFSSQVTIIWETEKRLSAHAVAAWTLMFIRLIAWWIVFLASLTALWIVWRTSVKSHVLFFISEGGFLSICMFFFFIVYHCYLDDKFFSMTFVISSLY